MRPHAQRPSPTRIARALDAVRLLPLTYWERGGTAWTRMPAGYAHDEVRERVGEGEADWQAAREAVRTWRMFPAPWASVAPAREPRPGAAVMALLRVLGVWWAMPARVVYVVEEPARYGFAYGTLPGHREQGEELFSVERDADGVVYYRLRAFSRPGTWLAALARPYLRYQQARFRADSLAAVREAVAELAPRFRKTVGAAARRAEPVLA